MIMAQLFSYGFGRRIGRTTELYDRIVMLEAPSCEILIGIVVA
jgi:hypothetical protein